MKNRLISSAPRSLLRAAAWAAFVLCLQPASARAASVNVNCTAVAPPPGVFTSITAALATLDNTGPHTVTVIGPCTESVNIIQRDRLTIQAPVGQTATISPPAPGPTVINVNGSHNILLRNLVLSGGGNGLVVSRGSTVTVQGLLITGNIGGGIVVNLGSVVNLGGPLADQSVTVSDNEGNGVFLDFNGALSLTNAVVSNNTEGGVRVARSSVGGFGLGNTFGGNGGPHISCDDTSLIHGTGLTDFGKGIECKNIEHEKGPSRPSVPKEHD